jgi:hypothetical protein
MRIRPEHIGVSAPSKPITTGFFLFRGDCTDLLYPAVEITRIMSFGMGISVIVLPDLVTSGVESGRTSSRAASRILLYLHTSSIHLLNVPKKKWSYDTGWNRSVSCALVVDTKLKGIKGDGPS